MTPGEGLAGPCRTCMFLCMRCRPWIAFAALVAMCSVPLSVSAQTPATPAPASAPAADAPAPEAAPPRIEFETLEHDFGHAVSGAQLKETFTFRNAGASALVIQSVKGG